MIKIKRFPLLWLCGFIALSGVALAADEDLARFGDQNAAQSPPEGNPIIPGLFADPSLARFGDTYYLYTTTDGFGWETGRWVVWKSRDFVHWSFSGESFPEITGQSNWAPGKPIFRQGRYWLPFTWHGNANYLASAERPEGPFRFEAGGRPLTQSIDAEVFEDDDGTPYWISDNVKPRLWRMKADMSGLEAKLAEFDFKKGYIEGAYFFKRKGVYYAGAANLGYAEYRMVYAMSDKPEGPWRYPENNFMLQPAPADHLWGVGHGHILQLPGTDEWIVIYLRSRMGERVDPFQTSGNVYRQICADRITFQADGTIKEISPTRKGVGLLAASTETGRDLAFGKAASASSSLPRYGPGKAVDGSYGTRWIAGGREAIVPTAETQPGRWKWSTERPADDWAKPGFKADAWQENEGGFGTAGTLGAMFGSNWNTPDIWLRREVRLSAEDLQRSLQLRLHHDEDVEVYLNGVLAAKLTGFSVRYESAVIAPEALAALKPGVNVLAAHCHQTGGGQFIDVGITAAPAPWWQVDLGATATVARTEISFNYPTEITPYVVESSVDGAQWTPYADHRQDAERESPKVDRKTVQARYLRVRFAAYETGSIPAGLWDLKAFGE